MRKMESFSILSRVTTSIKYISPRNYRIILYVLIQIPKKYTKNLIKYS